MADLKPVHFFDLYSDQQGSSKSWSPNTLRTRAVLNFKGIPYTQSWHSYTDIKPLMTGLGVSPREQGRPYTLPAILHSTVVSSPSGAMMDSLAIALHLDKLYPSPPLFPSGDASYALLIAVVNVITRLEPGFRPLIIPLVPDHLDPPGRKYFHETRTVAFGKPLSEVRPTDKETLDGMWELVEAESAVLVHMLKGRKGKKGPFFEGERAGYADLVYTCQLATIERFDKELFGKFMGLGNGEFRALYDACLPWLEGQGEDREWPISMTTSS
ncbi:hypothetical protein N7520_000861 [Penicillium odoratum]|uniref:uncharacterized protein n=1 Tax=Penicillium odoratum TaxID=1167516 RepID=UPI0025484E85|nr:uncharacterized protein N7520_000861 [Penicillium odoratum]KAJ5777615.1 hypothetical protein N7520_000861 [Penicillium odoratum]